MVPNSRTPVRGVSTRNDGNTLRAVWQDEAGFLQAQTQVFQREGGGAGDIGHCGSVSCGDAGYRRAETILYGAFGSRRCDGNGKRQVPKPAAQAQTHHSATKNASHDKLQSRLFQVS